MLQLPTGVVYQSVLCLLHRPFTVYRMSKKHRWKLNCTTGAMEEISKAGIQDRRPTAV